MTAAHDHDDLRRRVDRMSPDQVRRLRVLAAGDPELQDLLGISVSGPPSDHSRRLLLALAGAWKNGPVDAAERHDVDPQTIQRANVTPAAIVGTGPLVALLNENDAHHAQCVELFASLAGTPLVPTSVMAEACWLLEGPPAVEAQFLDAVAAGAFNLVPTTIEDVTRMAELVRQCADFPLGAVDASVVALAERFRRPFRGVRLRHVRPSALGRPTARRATAKCECWFPAIPR